MADAGQGGRGDADRAGGPVPRVLDASTPNARPPAPHVSVVMANWQGERHLAAAIASVLAQGMGDLELLVADDASGDGSLAIAQAAAERDARVRVLPAAMNEGPSAARNRALDAARGEWLAIVDSDDLLHPRRFEILLDAAARLGADMVADDMSFFGEGPGASGRTLLAPLDLRAPRLVEPALFVASNAGTRGLPTLGYLKVMVRREAMGGLRYDPTVRVGEDYDLYLRLLLRGLRFALLPWPLYLYRRHAASLSHRLSMAALEPLAAAHEAVVAGLASSDAAPDPALARALARRGRSLGRALGFERLVGALKTRRLGTAARLVLREPALLGPLARAAGERLARRRAGRAGPAAVPARIALVAEGASVPAFAAQAGRDGVLAVPPLAADRPDAAPGLRELACRLSALAARGPVEVAAVGPGGLDGLGLLPAWERADAWLTDEEAAVAPPPPGATLRRPDSRRADRPPAGGR